MFFVEKFFIHFLVLLSLQLREILHERKYTKCMKTDANQTRTALIGRNLIGRYEKNAITHIW